MLFPANEQMVDRLICEGALWSPAVIAAFRATPREHFLERIFQLQRKSGCWREVITREPGPRELDLVYADRALITHLSRGDPANPRPIAPISSSSQPSLMAQMIEDLHLQPGLRVLEIGAGTGYNAALMAHVVGPDRVISIDLDARVLAEAWDHLRKYPERKVEVRQADGRQGHAAGAPYDRIMVTAACDELEPAWLEQLADRGILLAPWNLASGLAFLVRGIVKDKVFLGRLTRPAYFLPLRGEQGLPVADPISSPGPMQQRPAPWAGWFERKTTRSRWLGLVQALAFYGWLRGLTVLHGAGATGQPSFAVSDGDSVCWYGPSEWKFNAGSGRDLGWHLWRAFLDAGGPWPSEFRVRVSDQGGLHVERPESYLRQGPGGRQLWELIPARDRPFNP